VWADGSARKRHRFSTHEGFHHASFPRLFTVDAATGVATFKAALSAAAGDDNPCTALTGSQFGVDFNPVADRLGVISDTGLNLRAGRR